MAHAGTVVSTRPRRFAGLGAVLGLSLALLTACAIPDRTPAQTSSASVSSIVVPSPSASAPAPATASPTRDPDDPFATAPIVVRDRVQLPSCGSESRVHGIGINVEGRRCFGAAALANQGAEFVSSLVTIEGDPIVYIFRILPESRGAEAFLDSTRDRWSSRKWLHFRCRSLLLEETTPGIPEIGLGPDCVERELT